MGYTDAADGVPNIPGIVRRFSSLGHLGELQQQAIDTVIAVLGSLIGPDERLLAYADRPTSSSAGVEEEGSAYAKEQHEPHADTSGRSKEAAPADFAVDACALTDRRIMRATITPARVRMVQVAANEPLALRVSMNSAYPEGPHAVWDAPSASMAIRLPRHLRHKDETDWWVWQPQFGDPQIVWEAVRVWQTRGATPTTD